MELDTLGLDEPPDIGPRGLVVGRGQRTAAVTTVIDLTCSTVRSTNMR